MQEILGQFHELVCSDIAYHVATDQDLRSLVQLAKLTKMEIDHIYASPDPALDEPAAQSEFMRQFSGLRLNLVLTRAQLLEHLETLEEKLREQVALTALVSDKFETSGMHPQKAIEWLTDMIDGITTQMTTVETLMQKLRETLDPFFAKQAQIWKEWVSECEKDSTFDMSLLEALPDTSLKRLQKIAGGILPVDIFEAPESPSDFESLQKLVNKLLKKTKDKSHALRIEQMMKTLGSRFQPALIQKLTQYYQNNQQVQNETLKTIHTLESNLSTVHTKLQESLKKLARTRLYEIPKTVESAKPSAATTAKRVEQAIAGK